LEHRIPSEKSCHPDPEVQGRAAAAEADEHCSLPWDNLLPKRGYTTQYTQEEEKYVREFWKISDRFLRACYDKRKTLFLALPQLRKKSWPDGKTGFLLELQK